MAGRYFCLGLPQRRHTVGGRAATRPRPANSGARRTGNSAKKDMSTAQIVRVPGLVHASSVVDFEAFKNDDVYKAGPDLGGHDSEMIGGAARGARLEEKL